MFTLPGVGFEHRADRAPMLRPVALVQLIAIVALALSTLIAATAVSIGFARAAIGAPVATSATAPTASAH
jgi:hypothetical protein